MLCGLTQSAPAKLRNFAASLLSGEVKRFSRKAFIIKSRKAHPVILSKKPSLCVLCVPSWFLFLISVISAISV